jgi:uncharacterized protein (TIGR02246 family)
MTVRVALSRVVFALALASTFVATVPAAAPSVDLKEIEKVERTRLQAWIKGDAKAMDPMLGEDLLYCHASTVCQNKKEIMEAIASKTTDYRKMDIISFKPRALGPDAVLINGKLDIVVFDQGKELKFQGIYTDAYVKRDGRWQLVSWQSTRVP